MGILPLDLFNIVLSFSHMPPRKLLLCAVIDSGRNKYGWDADSGICCLHSTRILHDAVRFGCIRWEMKPRAIALHNLHLLEIPYKAFLMRSVLKYREWGGTEPPANFMRMLRDNRFRLPNRRNNNGI